MSIEAFYRIEFEAEGMGGGVVVLKKGRILGGDSSFTYIGKYELEGEVVSAEVKCKNDGRSLNSVFADNEIEFTLYLEGTVDDYESFVLEGHKSKDQSQGIRIRLNRRAELP